MDPAASQNPLRAVHLNAFQECMEKPAPSSVFIAPSMMSTEERRFLYGLAKLGYRGEGHIVDGGAFLGGSTLAFGTGIQDNAAHAAIVERFPKPVVTFEQGLIRENLVRTLEKHSIEAEEGGSFIPALEKHIAPVADLVELRVGDIMEQGWEGPIEILYLDVLKTLQIQNHVFNTFFPSLVEGGLVLQQDYFIQGMAPLKMKQEFCAEYFDYVGEIASMAIFRAKTSIPADVLAVNVRTVLDMDEQLDLLAQARDRSVDIKRRFLVDLSRVRILAFSDLKPDARVLWEEIKDQYPVEIDDTLKRMNKAVAQVEILLQDD